MQIFNFINYWINITAIYSIFALSLNFQYGHGGLVNFGQVFFLCFGAYTIAITAQLGVHFAVSIVMAMAISGFVGFLMSYTARNMGGTYWGIATLAVGEIVRIFFLNENWAAGGANGISFDVKIPYFQICQQDVTSSFPNGRPHRARNIPEHKPTAISTEVRASPAFGGIRVISCYQKPGCRSLSLFPRKIRRYGMVYIYRMGIQA